MTEWHGDLHSKYPWLPTWIPSHESLVAAFTSIVPNVTANLTAKDKTIQDKAVEGALVVAQAAALLLMLLGVPALPLPFVLTLLIGVALIVVGLYYVVAGVATLATKLSIMPTPGPTAVLVTEGVCRARDLSAHTRLHASPR